MIAAELRALAFAATASVDVLIRELEINTQKKVMPQRAKQRGEIGRDSARRAHLLFLQSALHEVGNGFA